MTCFDTAPAHSAPGLFYCPDGLKGVFLKSFIRDKFDSVINFFLSHGIITPSTVAALSEEEVMNHILRKVHKYKIYHDDHQDRWVTYVSDESNIRGRRLVTRKNLTDLKKYLLEFYSCDKTYTFDNLYEEFMQYKSKMQAPTTIDAYIKSYKRFYQNDPIIHEDLNKLSQTRLEMWLADHVQKYQMDYKAYHKFSVLFSQMYDYAKKNRYVTENPFDYIDVKRLGLVKNRRQLSASKAFTRQESADINEYAWREFQSKPDCVPLAIMFVFQTGIRLGEAAALKWSDIDFEHRQLHVQRMERNQQNASKDFRTLTNHEYVIVDDTKGEFGARVVDLTDDALFILDQLKKYYESEGICSEWLFTHKNGKIHDRALDLRIRKYCEATGTDIKSLHKIRSTFISMLRDAGMSFEKIAEEVGHQQIQTTMNNYSFDVNTNEDNIRMLNAGLNFRPKKKRNYEPELA